MNYRTYNLAWIAITLIALAPLGCNSSGPSDGPDMDEMAAQLNRPKPADASAQPPTAAPAAAPTRSSPQPQTSATALPGGIVTSNDPDDLARRPTPPAQPAAAVDASAHPEARQVTAKDPRRGKVFHNQPGYLNAVFSARFFAENSLTFDKVTHALDLYRATEGNFPKTHEEFMAKIINENMIQLPDLEPGWEYWYDGSDGILKMRKTLKPGETGDDATAPAEAD